MKYAFPAKHLVASLVFGVMCLGVAGADDWPNMLGPTRDGKSAEKGLARTWPEKGPKVLWTVPLAAGYSSPSVVGNEIYILDRIEGNKDALRCLDATSGKELWNFAYEASGEVSHDGARVPPTVDAQYVYSVGMLGDFYCVDRKTHKAVWHKNLVKDFGLDEVPGWGVTQAPALYNDLVIVAPQAKDAYVVAYKKATGDLVWKSASQGLVGYSTPLVTKLGGVDQVVMVGTCDKGGATKGLVAGLSPADGKTLWTYDGWQCFIPIPHAAVITDDRLFITGAYKAGSALIQVKQVNGAWTVKELFKTKEYGSHIHQPMQFGDYIYLNSVANDYDDGLICIGLDGKVKWKAKDIAGAPTFERGALLSVDGLIIALHGKQGTLHLIEPSPDGYKEVAKSEKLLGGKEIWSPMALSNGKLFIRSQSEMKCLDLKNP